MFINLPHFSPLRVPYWSVTLRKSIQQSMYKRIHYMLLHFMDSHLCHDNTLVRGMPTLQYAACQHFGAQHANTSVRGMPTLWYAVCQLLGQLHSQDPGIGVMDMGLYNLFRTARAYSRVRVFIIKVFIFIICVTLLGPITE